MPDTDADSLGVTLSDGLDRLPEGIAIFDAAGRLAFVNAALANLVADPERVRVASREQLARALVQAADAVNGREAAADGAIDGLLSARSIGPVELRMRDGSHRLVTVQALPAGGRMVRVDDVTDLRAAEAAVEGNQEEFRSIFLDIPLPIRASKVSNWELLHESRAAAELFGEYRPLGTGRTTISSYADEGERQKMVAILLRDRQVQNYVIDMRRRDGTVFPALVSSRIIPMAGQEVSITSFHDLTEAKAAEKQLKEARETLEDAIEALSDGLIVYDANDRLITCNRQYKEYHGDCADLLVPGGYWPDITLERARRGFFEQAQPDVDAWFAHEMEQRGKAQNEEFTAGGGRWFEYSHRPTRQGGFVSTWRDITDRKRAEAELARQREVLHQNEKLSALGQLLAGVSHELNNPLSVLIGHAQLLIEEAKDAETREHAEKMAKAADRCARIVRVFLAMARQKPHATEMMDVNRVLDGALEVTGYGLRAAGVDLEADLAETLPQVEGDPDQINQVFVNLLINAQHALEQVEGRKLITVATRATPDGKVEITIADNGPGVPAQYRARIFEPFFTTKQDGKGTGIGLTLCHRIAEAHNGSIRLDSQPGQGAVFRIVLPAVEAARPREAPPEQTADADAPGRTLVIDDEIEIAEIIGDFLRRHGREVDIAGSGEEAFRMMRDREYAAILSDIRMPGIDGPTLYRELRDTRPDLVERLGFITGDTLSAHVKEFLESCGRPYLEKPLRPGEVARLVEQLSKGESGRA